MSGKTFRTVVPVTFGDVDYARILYYPRLFHYCHVVMERFFDEAVGIPYHTVLSERRLGFPTVHTEADYRRPMPYGEHLAFEFSVRALGTSSVSFRYVVSGAGDETPRAEARSVVVCVDMDRFEKQPLPKDLRHAFAGYLEV